MNKIEQIEQLLSKWKAVFEKTPRSKVQAYNYAEGAVCGIETALEILKRPSNTQIQTEACADKDRCDKQKYYCPGITGPCFR